VRTLQLRPLTLVCVLGIAFGVVLRVQQLGFPPTLTFDEHHFVENARNFLAGQPDWNDHPPLGKLLMAGAMQALGDTSVAWRLVSLLAGLANLALVWWLARALFRDATAAWLAATFFALDGFLIAYSRTALLDGMLLCAALATLLLLAVPSTTRVLLAGAGLGIAASIKLSGITLALPLTLAALALELRWSRRLLVLGGSSFAALIAFYAQYAIGQRLTGLPAVPAGVVSATLTLVRHHAALTAMTNPATSYWYTWFIPLRPIILRYDAADGWARVMTTLGNPLLWWCSAAVVVWRLAATVLAAARELASSAHRVGQRASAWIRVRWAELLPLAAYLGFLAPWVLTKRDSYIYHFLPSYGFGLVLLAAVAARARQRCPTAILCAVLVIAEVSVFYAPVWAQLPLSADALAWRLFLPVWR
jgi:dolichyl-phosphate-mannose--protein O-mannosyl transferase